MFTAVYRIWVLILLSTILFAVADESMKQMLKEYLVFCLKVATAAAVLTLVVIVVQTTWNGDRNVTDWLNPRNNRRRNSR